MTNQSDVDQINYADNTEELLCAALESALHLAGRCCSKLFLSPLYFTFGDDAALSASCRLENKKICISISKGAVYTLSKFWSLMVQSDLSLTQGNRLLGSNYEMKQHHISLVWLVQHELQHFELGHFELTDGTPMFNVVSHGKQIKTPLLNLHKSLWHKIEACLELQADHDAIELMLDSYSRYGWIDLRMKIASIAAVMILIEKADQENQIEHSTHPKAATRIFQLLGHVTEMWSLPAHAKAKARGETAICEDDLPSDEEKQKFSKEVILPAFWDAVALAEVAKAKSIISDLGSPEDFFADVARAKLGQWDELVTVGAKEWAELKDANDLILPLLPINQETN